MHGRVALLTRRAGECARFEGIEGEAEDRTWDSWLDPPSPHLSHSATSARRSAMRQPLGSLSIDHAVSHPSRIAITAHLPSLGHSRALDPLPLGTARPRPGPETYGALPSADARRTLGTNGLRHFISAGLSYENKKTSPSQEPHVRRFWNLVIPMDA
jgi:hypothetical protein